MALSLGEILRDEGYAVEHTPTVAAALAAIKRHRFDVAIIDQRLDDGDGLDVLDPLRASSPDVVPLILTAHGALEDAARAMREGACGYLLKPCNLDELKELLARGRARAGVARAEAEAARAVTEEARAEVERATSRAALLHDLAAELAGAATAADVAEAVVGRAARTTGASAGMVGVLVDDGAEIEIVAAANYPSAVSDGWRRFPTDQALPAADAVRTERAVFLGSRAERAARYPHLAPVQDALPSGGLAAIPLVAGGRTLGVFGLNFGDDRAFDAEERAWLETVANLCAQALDRARLFDEARVAIRARDEFLAIAAHELRTPLTVLRANTQMLQRGRDADRDPERGARLLGSIVDATKRLGALVDDLLDVTRLQAGRLQLRLQTIDLRTLVAEVVERHRQLVGPTHPLEPVLPPDECPLRADPERLRQVLDNVLDNAVKYSPDGGAVRIVLSPSPEGLHLRVRDQGIGVPPVAREAVFAPFGRASNAERLALPGMGLGLHIGRQIVEQHGGRLWLESRGEGTGTTVHVLLPADATAPAPA